MVFDILGANSREFWLGWPRSGPVWYFMVWTGPFYGLVFFFKDQTVYKRTGPLTVQSFFKVRTVCEKWGLFKRPDRYQSSLFSESQTGLLMVQSFLKLRTGPLPVRSFFRIADRTVRTEIFYHFNPLFKAFKGYIALLLSVTMIAQ